MPRPRPSLTSFVEWDSRPHIALTAQEALEAVIDGTMTIAAIDRTRPMLRVAIREWGVVAVHVKSLIWQRVEAHVDLHDITIFDP